MKLDNIICRIWTKKKYFTSNGKTVNGNVSSNRMLMKSYYLILNHSIEMDWQMKILQVDVEISRDIYFVFLNISIIELYYEAELDLYSRWYFFEHMADKKLCLKKIKKEYEKRGVVIKKTLSFRPCYELINFFKWDILYVNMSVILYWAEKHNFKWQW